MSDAIAELLNSKSSDNEPRERIVLIHRSDLYPDPTQDRDDWEAERTLAHIAGIRRSALIPLEEGRHYGIRKALWVEPADETGKHKIIEGECRWSQILSGRTRSMIRIRSGSSFCNSSDCFMAYTSLVEARGRFSKEARPAGRAVSSSA
ncbi:hypothetical protein Z046_33440 [Pseudomonas aeruginosa VRFPA09]|nr:hypothetical protein Z046_33440 [Pseudomonas aeruginosa VRFPA09]